MIKLPKGINKFETNVESVTKEPELNLKEVNAANQHPTKSEEPCFGPNKDFTSSNCNNISPGSNKKKSPSHVKSKVYIPCIYNCKIMLYSKN